MCHPWRKSFHRRMLPGQTRTGAMINRMRMVAMLRSIQEQLTEPRGFHLILNQRVRESPIESTNLIQLSEVLTTSQSRPQTSLNLELFEQLQNSALNQMNCLAGPSQQSQVQGAAPKDWHQSVTPAQRNYYVQTIIQEICPTSEPQAVLDPRMNNLVEFANKVESDFYAMADSRSEYIKLILEKLSKTGRELQEKKQQRKQIQEIHEDGKPGGPGSA